MAYINKNLTTAAVAIEDVEGVEQEVLDGYFVKIKTDGITLDFTREELTNDVLSGSIGVAKPRLGIKSASGSLSCYFKTSGTPGLEPEYGPFLESALGDVDLKSSTELSITGSTKTLLKVTSGAIWKENDIAMLCIPDGYHVTPITNIATNDLTILIPTEENIGAGVTIQKSVIYRPANEDHPSLSVVKWLDGAIKQSIVGAKVTGVTMSGFTPGQIPQLEFSFEGMGFDEEVSAQTQTPAYDDSLAPIALGACVWIDGVKVAVSEVAFSINNTLGSIISTCALNGKVSTRVTQREVTGSFNPYRDSASVANYTKWNAGTEFSLFFWAGNPMTTAGEYEDIFAVYMPKCVITSRAEADQDGIVQENISFKAVGGSGEEEVVIALF